MDRNLGVVQSEGVTIRSGQEGDSESHQLKENLLGSGLRYSVMRRSASDARYLYWVFTSQELHFHFIKPFIFTQSQVWDRRKSNESPQDVYCPCVNICPLLDSIQCHGNLVMNTICMRCLRDNLASGKTWITSHHRWSRAWSRTSSSWPLSSTAASTRSSTGCISTLGQRGDTMPPKLGNMKYA